MPCIRGTVWQSVYNSRTEKIPFAMRMILPIHRQAVRLALLVLAGSIIAPAHAARWVTLATATEAIVEFDIGSLDRRDDDKVQVWHRETYPRPQLPDSGAFSFARVTTLSEMQCGKRLTSWVRRSYFAINGSELKTEQADPATTLALPLIPDSALEAVYKQACKRSKPAANTQTPATTPTSAPAPSAPTDKTVDNSPGQASPPASRPSPKKARTEAPPPPAPWSYEGKTGAKNWDKLSAGFAACGKGERQSPIDIRGAIRGDLAPIRFAYKPVPLSIIDTGHTVQVNTKGGGSITVDDEEYELQQFHFHHPSEERINGRSYDMTLHLVHQSKAGQPAIVSVMIEAGKEHRLLRKLWSHLPLDPARPVTRADVEIDPAELLPETHKHYTYMGSLTTPPCSEGVLWLVMKTPIRASAEQIAGFARIYRNNARPIQPRNARVIKEAR